MVSAWVFVSVWATKMCPGPGAGPGEGRAGKCRELTGGEWREREACRELWAHRKREHKYLLGKIGLEYMRDVGKAAVEADACGEP